LVAVTEEIAYILGLNRRATFSLNSLENNRKHLEYE
jgi:hypothetical protein|tara:strand:- start:319 stop:426 length:108 start_codon:yes stop_codon:yes gene_type:complete